MSISRLRVAARTDAGLSRMTNEDSFVVADLSAPLATSGWAPALRKSASYAEARPPAPPAPVSVTLESAAGVALAVLDGMGGNCCGEVAARIGGDVFTAALSVAPPSGEEACRQRIVAAMNGASRAIFEAAAIGPAFYRGMGAAAVLAVVSGDRLHLAGAGDCRAYLLRAGRLAQLTRDDTLLNDYLAAMGPGADTSDIPAAVIIKALGPWETLTLQPTSFALRAGDVILLCTDGLSNEVDDATLAQVLRDLDDPAEAALALVTLANRGGGADNIAVVVARPEGDLPPPRPQDAIESRNVP